MRFKCIRTDCDRSCKEIECDMLDLPKIVNQLRNEQDCPYEQAQTFVEIVEDDWHISINDAMFIVTEILSQTIDDKRDRQKIGNMIFDRMLNQSKFITDLKPMEESQ